jgi:hypothetical protein
MRGSVFEMFVLQKLLEPGHFAVEVARRASTGDLTKVAGRAVKVPALVRVDSTKPLIAVDEALSNKRPSLVPTQVNYAAVDSFLVLNLPDLGWSVLALQITVSASIPTSR